jgi:hemoglobin-like flavoprotein
MRSDQSELIVQSIERAAERCDDLTPLVYERLFRLRPETEPMFRKQVKDLAKGEMLAQTLQVILDFVGERRYGARMIQCEVLSHNHYGVPVETFGVFFGVVADTIRDVIGADWTEATGEAWTRMLADLDYFATHPDQHETAAHA